MRDESWLLNAEQKHLSPAATRSDSVLAIRRNYEETQARSGYRLPFQRDRDRIIHASAFRNLMHKSQIFPDPLLSQYRTRLTHTLEVAQVARSISRRLGLNEDLTEAIALGHDLGHAPFGHMGERIIRGLLKGDKMGFEHNEHSLEIVDAMEDCDTVDGIRLGMNLTWATRQGILCHTRFEKKDYPNGKSVPPNWREMGYCSKEEVKEREEQGDFSLLRLLTPESQVVDIADEIAYLTHDLEDCRTAKVLRIEEVFPETLRPFMGERRKNALNDLINSVCEASKESIKSAETNPSAFVKIEYPAHVRGLVKELQKFFAEYIFRKDEIRRRNEEGQYYIHKLFEYWRLNPPERSFHSQPREIAKFIARKTDREIIHEYQQIFPPHFI